MSIAPDTKDWTWVLERECPDCGLDTRSVACTEVAAMLRSNAAEWQAVLRQGPSVHIRPAEDRWSALEYGCHVRDVFLLFRSRLRLMLEEDDPEFANWDQDETAVTERYGEQAPERVADELAAAASQLAADLDDVAPDAWSRTGSRSDGARFTVETFARYLVHDPVHHLYDVARR
jgi:hypothetical protein